jgi:hypothetical protein
MDESFEVTELKKNFNFLPVFAKNTQKTKR